MKSLDDLIPPNVPVRDARGRVYCNKKCAALAGILSRDLVIITYAERHEMENGKPLHSVAKYIGFCSWCEEMI